MNKNELIQAMSEAADITKAAAERALDTFTDTVTSTVKSGEALTLVGFGTFKKKFRAARTGRNPQTGKEMQIPEANVPTFKPGKKFKDAVNG